VKDGPSGRWQPHEIEYLERICPKANRHGNAQRCSGGSNTDGRLRAWGTHRASGQRIPSSEVFIGPSGSYRVMVVAPASRRWRTGPNGTALQRQGTAEMRHSSPRRLLQTERDSSSCSSTLQAAPANTPVLPSSRSAVDELLVTTCCALPRALGA